MISRWNEVVYEEIAKAIKRGDKVWANFLRGMLL